MYTKCVCTLTLVYLLLHMFIKYCHEYIKRNSSFYIDFNFLSILTSHGRVVLYPQTLCLMCVTLYIKYNGC